VAFGLAFHRSSETDGASFTDGLHAVFAKSIPSSEWTRPDRQDLWNGAPEASPLRREELSTDLRLPMRIIRMFDTMVSANSE
jgi:hypothetical protein